MTLTRKGKALLIATYILTALYFGWHAYDITHAIWNALDQALHFLLGLIPDSSCETITQEDGYTFCDG